MRGEGTFRGNNITERRQQRIFVEKKKDNIRKQKVICRLRRRKEGSTNLKVKAISENATAFLHFFLLPGKEPKLN